MRGAPARNRSTCYLLQVAMMVEPLSTDHLLSPALTTVKQLSLPPFQVVQKPSFDSFQVPSPRLPVPIGWRFILPSAVKVILNLRFDGVVAVKGLPSKKVLWISAGASLCGGRFCGGRFRGRGGRRDSGCDRHHTQDRSAKTVPAKNCCGERLSGQNARNNCTHGEPPELMIRKCMISDELDFVMTAVVCGRRRGLEF